MAALSSTAAFTRTHRLPSGLRVRLRLTRAGDQALVGDLLSRLGFDPAAGPLLDLVRFEPHQRTTICATALIDGGERAVGFGAVEREGTRAPAAVVADPAHGRELTRLIREALRTRSGGSGGRRSATAPAARRPRRGRAS